MGASKSRRERMEVGMRRARLLELGVELFGQRSADDVSTDDIAAAAGISKGLLYHYFAGKHGFLVETLRFAASRLHEQVVAAVAAAAPDPRSRLTAGLGAYLDYVEGRGPAYVALLRGGMGLDAEISAIVERSRADFTAQIVEGLAIAESTPMLRVAMRGWTGLVEGACSDWLQHRDVEREALIELFTGQLAVALMVAGVDLSGFISDG